MHATASVIWITISFNKDFNERKKLNEEIKLFEKKIFVGENFSNFMLLLKQRVPIA